MQGSLLGNCQNIPKYRNNIKKVGFLCFKSLVFTKNLFVSLSCCLFLSFSLFVSLSLSLCLFSLCLCLSLSLFEFLFVCLSLCLSLSFSLCFSFSLSRSLSDCRSSISSPTSCDQLLPFPLKIQSSVFISLSTRSNTSSMLVYMHIN